MSHVSDRFHRTAQNPGTASRLYTYFCAETIELKMFTARLHFFLAACTAFVLLFSSCAAGNKAKKLQTKEWGEYYKEHLTPKARLIAAGTNFTLERVPGKYLYKTYFYDTKTITGIRYYADRQLNIQMGLCEIYSDFGVKFLECHYLNNALHGKFREFDVLRGWKLSEAKYVKGKLEGEYLTFDSTGAIRHITHYDKGELDGISLSFNEKGDTIVFEEYRRGNMINQHIGPDRDPSSERMAAFPCDSVYVSRGEKCSEFTVKKYLKDNIKYPEDAFDLNIQGLVNVSFVVDYEGNVTRVVIANGYCQSIRDECFRVVSGMPKWNPGSANGQPVKIKFNLPIGFWIR